MNYFYTLFISKSVNETENGFEVIVQCNPSHPVYQVHFPDNPITPGACLIQTTSTLLEHKLGHKVWLRNIKYVKFLSSIIPVESKEVKFIFSPLTVAEKETKVQVVITDSLTICAKMSLVFSHDPL